jgi:DNA-binding transcriptional LysR family regulator
MSRFDQSAVDHLDLDGHLLQLLLAVVDEGSVTRAAQRLDVTQSAVSHLLDKLRAITGDPLFVKAGRGIVPTAHALTLAARARPLLEELCSFGSGASFDPATVSATVTIAANELQRDLLLPPLFRALRARAPGLKLRVIASGIPSAELLRSGTCQLVISPRPPEAGDIVQKKLFEDRYRVFYDAGQRGAPQGVEDYLASEHVTVLYEPHRRLDVDEALDEAGLHRRFAVQVPGFAAIGPFLAGTPHLATLPSLVRVHMLRGFAMAPVPVFCPPMPMYMVWHLRHQADALHHWLREQLAIIVAPALAGAPPAPPAAGRRGAAPASAQNGSPT